MNNSLLRTIAVALIATASVGAQSVQPQGSLSVTVHPGASWETGYPPQIAVWVEKSDGTYITTLYATQRAVKKNWIFAPKNGRPESLPVWYHTSGQYSQDEIDTVSSATPKTSAPITKSVVLPASGTYIIKIEVNHSFDYNEFWSKKAKKNSAAYSGVNGQPSLIYTATIAGDPLPAAQKTAGNIQFQPAGTGSVTGADGKIHDQINTLTTALSIIDSAEAQWTIKK